MFLASVLLCAAFIIFILDFIEVWREEKGAFLACFRLNVLNKGWGTDNKGALYRKREQLTITLE